MYIATLGVYVANNEINVVVMVSQQEQRGLDGYVSPQIEVLYVELEGGYVLSNTENIGGEEPDQEW